MDEHRRELTGEHSLMDLRMGRPYSPTDPSHVPDSWTPTPDEYQLFAAERARFSMTRHWDQYGMISPNVRSFDYSNILPQTGPISGGVTLTHRPMPRYGPQLQFGEDCKTVRPRCPTCVKVDHVSYNGMDTVYGLERERREIMIEHLRRRVQHCGRQAAGADRLAYDWHREGNSASIVMHHFKIAHIEACRREQRQPPVGTPPPPMLPRETSYPSSTEDQPSTTNSVTLTKFDQIDQNTSPKPQKLGRRKSYTEAVKEGKKQRQSVVYASSNMVVSGSAKLPNPIQNGQEINREILNSFMIPLHDQETDHPQAPHDTLNTPQSYSPVSEAGDSHPGTPAQDILTKACHGTFQRNSAQQEAPSGDIGLETGYHQALLQCRNGQYSMKNNI